MGAPAMAGHDAGVGRTGTYCKLADVDQDGVQIMAGRNGSGRGGQLSVIICLAVF